MRQASPVALFSLGGPAAQAGFAAWLAGQRQRVALWAPVALGFGALGYFWLDFEPSLLWGAVAIGLALPAFAGAGRIAWPWLLAGPGLVALGFGAAILRAELVATPVLQERTALILLSGQVTEAYGHQDGRPRVTLALSGAGGMDAGHRPRLVRIALRKIDDRPTPGSWIELTGRLTPLPTPVAPGGYDFARAAYFDGIGAYGFALSAPRSIDPAGRPGIVQRFTAEIAAARHDASERIRAALPGSSGAIAAALTVGDRSEISQADEDALRDSSLAHVLSISGLHMAIVGLGVFGTLRFLAALMPWIALRFQVKKWAAGVALLAAGGYLMLSGASVPAQRSFIMIGLMFVAVMIDRSPFTLRVVAISALFVLLLAPESIVDPSFQMSFSAVTALVSAFEAFEAWQVRRGRPLIMRDTWRGRFGHALLIAILSSLVAGLATAPYAAYHFNRIAAYGLVANVLAMPVIGFVIMPAAAVTLLVLPFGLEWLPLMVMGWGLEAMLWIAHQTAGWPGASSLVPSAAPFALGLISLGGLWLALWRGGRRAWGLAPIAIGLILSVLVPGPDILIDRDAANVAVRAPDGRLAVLSGRRGRFAAEEWLERDGDASELKDSARRGRSGVWTCEEKICEAAVGQVHIVYIERAGSRAAGCGRRAAIVISAREIEPCPTGLTITPRETRAEGAHAITLSGSDMLIRTVRDEIGDRPWTVWVPQ